LVFWIANFRWGWYGNLLLEICVVQDVAFKDYYPDIFLIV